MQAKVNVRQLVTDQLLAAIESGTLPWRKTFSNDPNAGFASSLATGKLYSGVNQLLLQLASLKNGWKSRFFGTYNAIQYSGGQVRRGSKATRICLFNPINKTKTDRNGVEKTETFLIYKEFSVFNAEQCHGLDEYQVGFAKSHVPFDGSQHADEIIKNTGAKIEYGGNQACYRPGADEIHLPYRHQFENAEAYYETCFHELAHWSHHESRLNPPKRAPEENYAFEELVAEIAACYLMAECKLELDQNNSAAYLSSWVKALKNDSRFIFQASSLASKSADFILQCSQIKSNSEIEEPVPF